MTPRSFRRALCLIAYLFWSGCVHETADTKTIEDPLLMVGSLPPLKPPINQSLLEACSTFHESDFKIYRIDEGKHPTFTVSFKKDCNDGHQLNGSRLILFSCGAQAKSIIDDTDSFWSWGSGDGLVYYYDSEEEVARRRSSALVEYTKKLCLTKLHGFGIRE